MKEGKDKVQSLLLEEGERDGGWDLGIAGQPGCREPLRSRALWPLAVRRLNSTSATKAHLGNGPGETSFLPDWFLVGP